MYRNNINYNDKLIRFIELYKSELNILITDQIKEDKEFNISNKYKELMYLNNCFDYIDSIFKTQCPFISWNTILNTTGLDTIRKKLAFLGYDLDTMLSLYTNLQTNIQLDFGINENPILESIPIKTNIFTPTPVPITPIFEYIYLGKTSSINAITEQDITNATRISTTELNKNIEITINNLINQYPFIAVIDPRTVISIQDDNDETIQDYIQASISFSTGPVYNYIKLDGITTLQTFNRIIKIN